MKKKRILVVGGTGFIGNNLFRRLSTDSKYDLISFSNQNVSLSEKSEGVKYYIGDITNKRELAVVMDGVDVVINLAAIMGVKESIKNTKKYFEVNVLGTLNLLDLCANKKLDKFILASSDAIYGSYPLSRGGIDENFGPLTPPNPYSVSKLAQEHLCRTYGHNYKLPLVVLRFSNVYGPGQHEKNMIWSFIEDADKDNLITIFGDGSHGRDFTYVADAVDGIVRAMTKGKLNKAYHVSSGTFLTAKELAEEIVLHFPGSTIKYIPKDSTVVSQGYLSVLEAKKDLGYTPQILPVNGIKNCIEYYRKD